MRVGEGGWQRKGEREGGWEREGGSGRMGEEGWERKVRVGGVKGEREE